MPAWTLLPGTVVNALANGADGSIWHVGQSQEIYRWNGSDWQLGPPCRAVRVTAAWDGAPWHIGIDGVIYRWFAGRWERLAGTYATELAIGGDSAWHIGRDGAIYRWRGANGWTRDELPGRAKRIAVQADGTPWCIDERGLIHRRVTDGWRQAVGPAGAIAAGPDGSIYHAGDHGTFTWFTIYRWDGAGGWTHFSDSVTGNDGLLAVDRSGGLWSSPGASYSQLYRYL
jgi:hypothetical protein